MSLDLIDARYSSTGGEILGTLLLRVSAGEDGEGILSTIKYILEVNSQISPQVEECGANE